MLVNIYSPARGSKNMFSLLSTIKALKTNLQMWFADTEKTEKYLNY